MIGVYEIVNTANGHRYVGSSVRVEQRLRGHRHQLDADRHPNPHLQAAWNRYGSDAFVFRQVLETTRDEILVKEQEELERTERGLRYNIAVVVDAPMSGRRHNDATKIKMRGPRRAWSDRARAAIMAGRTDVTRQKLRAANLGKKHSDETRAKMSKPHAKPVRPSFGHLGKRHSEEARAKMSAGVRAYLARKKEQASVASLV